MNKLTKAQEEYFKDSQIRDMQGNLVPCYHMTSAQFDAFDKNKIGGHNAFYGKGFYFSTSDKYDEAFGEKFKGAFGENQLVCYIEMKNPLVLDDLDFFEVEEIMQYLKDNHPDYGKEGGPFEIAIDPKDYPKSDDEYKLTPDHWCSEIFKLGAWAAYAEQITNYAKENGYDGIIQAPIGTGPVEIIVFEPNQIKSVDNLYPTKSDNFRDNSREYLQEHLTNMSLSECLQLTKHIKEQEKNQKDSENKRNTRDKDAR